MNPDDLERLLGDSFDRQARASVGDGATPPRPRYLDQTALSPRPRRTARILAPLAAAAAVVALVAGIVVVQHRPTTHGTVAAPGSGSPQPSIAQSTVTGPHTAVHVSLLNSDGSVVGVGMPVIAYFSKPITDASALARATSLTVNGKAEHGAWFFERSNRPGYPIEGHYRLSSYWPADARIDLRMPIKGLSGGGDFAYDDSLTLDFSTGPEQVVTVDDVSHKLTLRRDGQTVETADVSLGARSTPTLRGVKVIMDKGGDVSMRGPGYYYAHVKWAQRLTYGGEFLHAAPWNEINIQHGVDSSNGCTNLMPSAAKKLYAMLRIGDVVDYPNATGPKMSLSEGYGDWNISWPVWLTGGAVPTS